MYIIIFLGFFFSCLIDNCEFDGSLKYLLVQWEDRGQMGGFI